MFTCRRHSPSSSAGTWSRSLVRARLRCLRSLSGPRRDASSLPANQEAIEESHTGKQSTFLVRTSDPVHDPAWTVRPVTLDDLVIAYLGRLAAAPERAHRPQLKVMS
jgi:ABC-2 type transport system ATP-binding protein